MFRFAGFTLDVTRGQVRNGERELELRPKSFEVLRFMVENADRLATKEEIIGAIWPDVFVTDDSLSRCISDVRLALGDTDQRIIKTVPKRGYIFMAPVHTERPDKRDRTESTQQPEQHDARIPEEAGRHPDKHRLSDRASVAVLPFTNLSGDVSQEYLSDGITEDIINGLSYFSDLSVIARNSSFSYKGRSIDVREVGEQLGVRYIVEGSVRRFGDRIRITAQLVDALSGTQKWAERFDRVLGDVFAVQDEITQSVVAIVVAHLGSAEGKRVLEKPPSSWTAYDLLMQGEQALKTYEQSWTPSLLYKARRHLAEAYKADPASARIAAMLGHTYVRAYADPAAEELGDAGVLQHGYDLVSRAVGLDPNLPLARAQLGWAHFWMHQPDAAVPEYEKAFALNPSFSDWRFPVVLVYAGEAARALDVARKHVHLDPYHPPHLYAFQGHALYMLKRYQEAIAPLRECIRRGPQILLGHVWLAATLVRLGEYAEARSITADILKRTPQVSLKLKRWRAPWLYRNPQDTDDMVEALGKAGL